MKQSCSFIIILSILTALLSFGCKEGFTASDSFESPSITPSDDITAPTLSLGLPSGQLSVDTSNTTLQVTTTESSTCKYFSSSGTAYPSMPNTFSSANNLIHTAALTGLSNATSYNYYVRCADSSSNVNTSDYVISFSIAAVADVTAPVLSNGSPTSSLSYSTTQTTLSVSTNENATCKYSTTSGTAYSSMSNTFSTTGGASHSTLITGLAESQSYSFYVRCVDGNSNSNSSDYTISFSVDTSSADPLSSLDDDFNTSSIDGSWLTKNSSNFTVTEGGGSINFTLNSTCGSGSPYCVWYNSDNGGAFVYKNVTGNFKVTSLVRARSAANTANPVPVAGNYYLFAGLMARDPASDSGSENYVFSVTGVRGSDGLTNETKNTVNGSSSTIKSYIYSNQSSADLEIRLCAVGQMFYVFAKENGYWVQRPDVFNRTSNPLANTLQVGMITYNYSSNYDIEGQFDYIRFATVSSLADCSVD